MRCTKQRHLTVVQGQRCVNVCVCVKQRAVQVGSERVANLGWKGVRRLPAWQLKQCAPHGLTPAASVSAASAASSAAALQVVTLIARAHHDATEHMAARRALARGLHMFPTDLKLRFNMAFVLQVGVGAGSVPVRVPRGGACLLCWAVCVSLWGCEGGGKWTGHVQEVTRCLVPLRVVTPSSCICALHAVIRAD